MLVGLGRWLDLVAGWTWSLVGRWLDLVASWSLVGLGRWLDLGLGLGIRVRHQG